MTIIARSWRAQLAALALAGAFFLAAAGSRAAGPEGEFGQLQYGKYLVTVGDCAACHSAERGQPMAGGRPLLTPFGTIYSANLTPDPQTGIGSWTSGQFYRAMHKGLAANGSHLYPAFPYPWFTKISREDSDAIQAYLNTLPAVKYEPPAPRFAWPLNNRFVMNGWNILFFSPHTFQQDASKSAQWNRGAYLVEGLAHCGACHSPKNIFGAVEGGSRYQGAALSHWFAPNLTGDSRNGLGNWSGNEIVQFLKTGRTARTIAYGPMAQVVSDSTSGMTESDLTAIAVYLKALPAAGGGGTPAVPAQAVASAGKAIYDDSCSACHGAKGEGVPGMFPALKADAVAQQGNPVTVLRLILNGGHSAAVQGGSPDVDMPAFGWKLSNQQVADVASYVRSAWGNKAAPVSAGAVSTLRSAVGHASSAD